MKQEVVNGRALEGGFGLVAGPVHIQSLLQPAELGCLVETIRRHDQTLGEFIQTQYEHSTG